MQKGKLEGIQEGVQAIASEMLINGMDIIQIAKFTKLSKQEISKLKTKLGNEQ